MLRECDVLLWYFTSPRDAGGLLRRPQKSGDTLCSQREGTDIPLLPPSLSTPGEGKRLLLLRPLPNFSEWYKRDFKIYFNLLH